MESIEDKIQRFFIDNGLTLSLAESCTGGNVSARLVQVPDCSRYFLGCIVSYSRQAKEALLRVDSHTLASFGEVSAQTAEKMAQGALHQFGSSFALAITGIAGPAGGSLQKPVGTVFFALAHQEKTICRQCNFKGSRAAIIAQSTDTALSYLWKELTTLLT